MKRVLAFASAFILVICCCLTVYSFEIDGIDDGVEWYGSNSVKLLDGESNCKVNLGIVKWSLDSKNNGLYLCFMFSESELTKENINVGISLTIEDSEPFVLTMSSTPNSYDIDKYSFDGAMSVDENKGVTCEIRIGMKYGLPSQINGKVRFIDSDGSPSNFYDFTIDNETYVEETAPIYKEENPIKPTTKKSSTIKSTTKESSKTTQSYGFDFLDFLLSEETTSKKSKSKTTTKKSTTSKSEKTTKSSVKIIEKEIYISAVTEPAAETPATTSSLSQVSNSNAAQSNISLSEGSKYKTFTAIAGGIALIAVAVLGTLGSNKKAKNNNDPKS